MKTAENLAPSQSFRAGKEYIGYIIRVLLLVAAYVIIYKKFSVGSPDDLYFMGLKFLIVKGCIYALAGCGLALVVIGRGFDFSLPAIALLSGSISATMLVNGEPFFISLATGCGAGVACGVLNGLLCAYMRLSPYIATICTWLCFNFIDKEVVKNEALFITKASGKETGFEWFMSYSKHDSALINIPVALIVAAVILVLVVILFKFSLWGRNLRACGSNPQAARECGINVRGVRFSTYVIAGFLAGAAGVLGCTYTPDFFAGSMAYPFLFDLLPVVLIGGCALSGGRGSIIGTIISAFIVASILGILAVNQQVGSLFNITLAIMILLPMIILKLTGPKKAL